MSSTGTVVVSKASYDSDQPHRLVESNVTFVNALLREYLTDDEVPSDALKSYFVDYYLAQLNNGGFSQFVYNSRWQGRIVGRVREGLRAIGASGHLALFERGAEALDRLTSDQLLSYMDGNYFGENQERDQLDKTITEAFFLLQKSEDLMALNSSWLRALPQLSVLTASEIEQEIARRGAALPDRELRIARARANEPPYMKLIRALCASAGQQFAAVTFGDPTHKHKGKKTLAWHFTTDRGGHYMVLAGGKALLFRDGSKTVLTSIDAPTG